MGRRKTNPWDRRGEGSPSAARALAGVRAQKEGVSWEATLAGACKLYALRSEARILHVGAPFKLVGRQSGHLRTGVFAGKGGGDFMGFVCADGFSVPFEADAKETTQARWSFSELKDHQAHGLESVAKGGGYAGVLLSMQGRSWWLPWADLGPLWWAWSKTRDRGERAKPGTASLNLRRCMAIGHGFRGGDFLPAVLGGPRG